MTVDREELNRVGIELTEGAGVDEALIFDVTINLEHNDGLDMSLDGNPTITQLDDFQVFSLFRRRRLSTSEADGNPLIYALKSLKNFRIDDASSSIMWNTAEQIFESWACPWNPTCVVSVPSRHSVSNDLAQQISGWLGIEHLPSSAICKKTVAEVIADAERLKEEGGVAEPDLRAFKKQLGRLSSATLGKSFQMKEIKDVQVRHYFHPWKSSDETEMPTKYDILLVDDLIGSGASLKTCADYLTGMGCSVVGGMSLFSPLDREMAKPAVARKLKRRGKKT